MSTKHRVYAAGLLKVCRFSLRSPPTCAGWISGSHLKTRLERIVTGSVDALLSARKVALMSCAAVLAVAAPLATGLIGAFPAVAQTNALNFVSRETPATMPPAVNDPTDPNVMAADQVATEAPEPKAIARRLNPEATLVAPGDASVALPIQSIMGAIDSLCP